MAPIAMTFEYRSYRPILSILQAEKNLHHITPSNEAPQLPQSSPMGPTFFLAQKDSICNVFWAYEPGAFPKKAQIRNTGGGPPVWGVGHRNFDFGSPLGIF